MILPQSENGDACRWRRQSGYVVARPRWQSITPDNPFDPLAIDHYAAYFRASKAELEAVESKGDLLGVQDDAIAKLVYSFFHLICEDLKIAALFSHELNRYGFKNPKTEIHADLDAVATRARSKNRQDCLAKIERLREEIDIDWNTFHNFQLGEIQKAIESGQPIA